MDKDFKNRSGSISNGNNKTENRGNRKKAEQPGGPSKSNRQTKGNDESGPVQETGNKKGSNSI